MNADGWGVGWWDPLVRPEPARYRTAVADVDRPLVPLGRRGRPRRRRSWPRSAAPRHRRRSSRPATPPSPHGPWLFSLNGFVRRLPRTGRRGAAPRRHRASGPSRIDGTSDSEVLFALVLDALDAGATPSEALAEVIGRRARARTEALPQPAAPRRARRSSPPPAATRSFTLRGRRPRHRRRARRQRAARRRRRLGRRARSLRRARHLQRARRSHPCPPTEDPHDRAPTSASAAPSRCTSPRPTSPRPSGATLATASPPTPKHLPPKWFYDERGSLLFDDITRLTSTTRPAGDGDPRARGRRHRPPHRCHHASLELGSGTSTKTQAPARRARPTPAPSTRIVPFDVCEPMLRDAGPELAARYPGRAGRRRRRRLRAAPRPRSRWRAPHVVAFLGGTIGNLTPAGPGQVPPRAHRPDGARRLAPARHRPREGPRPAGRRLRRRRRRHRRVQPQRPARPQPRARRRPRRRIASPTWPVEPGRAVDRDAPAGRGRPARPPATPSTSTSTSPTAR